MQRAFVFTLHAMLLLGAAKGAFAQTNGPVPSVASTQDDLDIVVTAQRREERLQDVPIAIAAASAQQLAAAGVADTVALKTLVPGLEYALNGNAGNFFLRGVGSTAGNPSDEQSVAFYVDGVYIAAPSANQMGLANIERIEVLKGPQGTLFGRNATGGVIQIITKEPSITPAFNATLGYGNYDTVQGSLYVTGGLTDTLALDLAASGSRQDNGFGINRTTGSEAQRSREASVRSSMLFNPSDATKIRLTLDYSVSNSTGFDARLVPGVRGIISGFDPPDGSDDFYDTYGNLDNKSRVRQLGAALHVDQDLGFASIVSISAYRDVRGQLNLDQDTTPLQVVDALLTQRSHNFSQEVQLLSPKSSPIDWIVGGYYYNASAAYSPALLRGIGIGLPPILVYGDQKTKSYSAFGQITVPIIAGLNISGGLRYTDEKQRYEGHSDFEAGGPLLSGPAIRTGFKKLTYRGAVNYKFSDDIMAYVSHSRGVKSGGFNLLAVNPNGNTPYRPEVLDSTEIGFKSDLFDRLLRLNLAAFHYKYRDIQLQTTGIGGLRVYNAAAARINGFEAEMQLRPTRGLTLSGALSVLDGKYTNFRPNAATGAPGGDILTPNPNPPYGDVRIGGQDFSGFRTVRTPKFTGNVGATYEAELSDGKLTFSANAAYNDGFIFSVDQLTRQKSYTIVNGSVRYGTDKYDVTLWGKNLLNERYYSSLVQQELGDLYTPAAPVTYGVTVGVHF